MSQYQIATQPMTDSIESCTPPLEFENAWGRFYPLNIKISKFISLCPNQFTFGRHPQCDYTLTVDEVEERFYACISSFHFRVKREEPAPGVFVTLIQDLSSNGTFINGKCIGRDQSVVLTNHDSIGIAAATYTVFVYQDLNISGYAEHPSEISDHYAIFNLLGKGGYGEVRLVFKKETTQCFAMKQIDIGPIEEKEVIDAFNEVKILRKLKHENVVKLSNINVIGNSMYLFLEYCHGGDLGKYVHKRTYLEENIAKHIFFQILLGVNYLHENKVIHRDLKPANILLNADTDYPKVKITDFGLSKFLDAPADVRTRCGTMKYAPPELQFSGVCQKYDLRADVWSLGVILYYCLSGALPFRRERRDMALEEQIKRASLSFDKPVWIKPELAKPKKMIINRCLQPNPQKRGHVKDLLVDEWFRTDEVYRKQTMKVLNKENTSSMAVVAKKKRN